MEDWLNNIRMCGGFVREFMKDPRAFHESCRIHQSGVDNHFIQGNANGEGSSRANEISDAVDIEVANLVEHSISAIGVSHVNSNAEVDDCSLSKTDEVDVDRAESQHVMHIPGSSSQAKIHADDNAEVEHCKHMSDRVDELQDDIMELYYNFVEGVRAPDVRIEEVDVIQVEYMEEELDVNQQKSYGRKRKIDWTFEEEEKLREGVKKFEKTRGKGKTMPWKQILEFGVGIFHPRRSADNLKDKWRRMCKQSSES